MEPKVLRVWGFWSLGVVQKVGCLGRVHVGGLRVKSSDGFQEFRLEV